MLVKKLQISPIYTGPGISKKVCSISMTDVSGQKAARYIKERLYLNEGYDIPISTSKPYVNKISEFLSRCINKG